ncbi:peptidase S8 and S53 subtilisin kexin sedolisin [Gemmatirosa kalamazoonensis]|uniref:Peptidase S8 and S53 subtilisin kexin sedolisin n=1 Tax=Gemmatirosa kalamazoonensis TaxID=861299 RepID=W0RCF0_9BACT|nr:S8 family serine peptidase [Gemmatirosa kalamazoonensis]AHG88122.1 peptidase S8 and S53 subtilisin kexin sedolisin [Gemmatirosa kalamazoonensis]
MRATMLGTTAVAVGTLAGLAACGDAPAPTAATRTTDLHVVAPSFTSAAASVPIAGSYIVVFRSDVVDPSAVARDLASRHAGTLAHLYTSALKGAALALSAADAARLASDPRVALVEQDQEIRAAGVESPTPSWGIDRVDQRALPLDNSYTYDTDGTGVSVYILDTGIYFAHPDFGGRAVTGVDEVTPGGTAADCHGHGTHVAGTVGGTSTGIAKKVRLVAVRVLDCTGVWSVSGVIAGVDWVTADVQKASGDPTKVGGRPASANMSLAGAYSATLNQAVENSIAAGVTYVIAAGNSTADACSYSPGSAPDALTIGATNRVDSLAYFSNRGACVDLLAPGVDIVSDWLDGGTHTMKGTSMAAPHVTGAAALYLAAHPGDSPAQVASALTSNATSGAIIGVPLGTPNLLLYTRAPAAPPPPPPVASFVYSCAGLTCSFTNTSTGATSYAWSFGDGTTSTLTNVSHTFPRRHASYTVTLTATNSIGATSSVSRVIDCRNKGCA